MLVVLYFSRHLFCPQKRALFHSGEFQLTRAVPTHTMAVGDQDQSGLVFATEKSACH